ncbi:pancreatic triacylglycerol lipase-like [Acomys russatus]|uniref:pancreatic triacylglycerol lipase-like n=1 Tax=Acomys russatus TaxID=60746 RepID=UPI0021E306F2|nr:pancreatic triacylglycerol lipase-like [Acomys russatus]
MTLIAKVMPQHAEEIREKRILTEEEGLEYLANIHRLTHLGPKKMTELVNKSPYHIPRLQKTAEDLVIGSDNGPAFVAQMLPLWTFAVLLGAVASERRYVCRRDRLAVWLFPEGCDSPMAWSRTGGSVVCHHSRSDRCDTDSIVNPTGVAGISCASYSDLALASSCISMKGPWVGGGCPQTGRYADRYSGKTSRASQKCHLSTGEAGNFARWRYQVAVTLSRQKVIGHILASLFGNRKDSKQYEIFEGSLQPGKTLTHEIDSYVDAGDLQKVRFIWYNSVISPTLPKMEALKITTERDGGRVFNFYSSNTMREDVLLTLTSCEEPVDKGPQRVAANKT